MIRSSSAEFKLRLKEVQLTSGGTTSRLQSTERQSARSRRGRRSLDFGELDPLKTVKVRPQPTSKLSAKADRADPALKSVMQSLNVRYFQELRNVRLPDKSSVNTVISFLSLLSSIDNTVAVSPSFHVLESQAQQSLTSYCSQPGNVVNTLRKLSTCVASLSEDSVRRVKDRLQRVNERQMIPPLASMLLFTKTAVQRWEAIHFAPSEPSEPQPQSHARKITPNFENSFAEVSFLKPCDEASLQDLSIYSMLRDHSPIYSHGNILEDSVVTLQDAFRVFLRAKLKCLKLTSRLIPIKAQALTKAAGSKTAWCKEFLETHEGDPLEVAELFADNRFKSEVLKVAELLA